MYEGRSINKLQNCVILLVLRLWKFWNIDFVGDLILSMSYEFYYNDVTMTSFASCSLTSVWWDKCLNEFGWYVEYETLLSDV